MKIIRLFIIVSALTDLCAQDGYNLNYGSDSMYSVESQIIDHSGIMDIVANHKKIRKKKVFAEGFRIQIYNGNNRAEAMKTKAEFYSKFPNLRCYINYQQPYYRVRVGDYVKQLDAKNDLRKMGRQYPSSFLVPDNVNYREKDEE